MERPKESQLSEICIAVLNSVVPAQAISDQTFPKFQINILVCVLKSRIIRFIREFFRNSVFSLF